MFFAVLAVALLYVAIGKMVLQRGMNHARNHALVDQQFFTMVVNDSSLSMRLLKALFVATWLPIVIGILCFLFLRSRHVDTDFAAA